jgi:UDP-N-acetylglucosamine:LPS N-acetylglucosamine transferase
MKQKRKIKVMLVASSGGHWVQLNRLAPAFKNCNKIFVTTKPKYRDNVKNYRFIFVPDANRWNKFLILRLALSVLIHLIAIRPDVVVSTGAAPGFFAVFFGKKLGAKTIWLDSIANVEELSMSGRMAGKHADLWLTQWEHLAKPDGPKYLGAVV